MIVSTHVYKGKPMISFRRDEKDRFPLTLGVKKCRTILEHIDHIQGFFEQNKHTLVQKREEPTNGNEADN